ncbi:hypothetical protein C8R45DRAFT_1032175 [Mycena sanguinolenta]|nr:hypothetical protein C8R45DRAFT_1032175 [Mycena sanguinolenta]
MFISLLVLCPSLRTPAQLLRPTPSGIFLPIAQPILQLASLGRSRLRVRSLKEIALWSASHAQRAARTIRYHSRRKRYSDGLLACSRRGCSRCSRRR